VIFRVDSIGFRVSITGFSPLKAMVLSVGEEVSSKFNMDSYKVSFRSEEVEVDEVLVKIRVV
jgi:hypothetical protein